MASDRHTGYGRSECGLKDSPCWKIARELGNRAVPFLIYSGYGEDRELLAEFHRVIWITKPVLPSALVQACQELLVSEG
jgi:hypothetical protein